MAPDEYWTERHALGAELRHLLWERRTVRTVFQGTKDTGLMMAGMNWLQGIWRREQELCRKIRELDLDYQEMRSDGELDQEPY